MSADPLILAIDQGTTSSRAIVFDRAGSPRFSAQKEFRQIYPDDGWVEHDPEEIWQSTLDVCRDVVQQAQSIGKIVAIGITNQRETTVVWNRSTGQAIYNAIVWQDRRTADRCQALREAGHETTITKSTGLLLDAYFSATKIAWILDNVEGARELAEKGELAFGTTDCFLIWKLTGGKVHATDASNASRTNLFDIHKQEWNASLLEIFDVPQSVLPDVRDSAGDYGATDMQWFDKAIPIYGVAGDQQAATVGQACFEPGMIKSTYGTGCFMMMNTGTSPLSSNNRLLTTIAYRLDGSTTYALEGSIFNAGTAVQWLRDGLQIIDSAEQTQALVKKLESNKSVYMVPAFTGLGAPYWDPNARGAIFGITRDTGRAEFVRAALESVCYQTYDLVNAMQQDGATPSALRVDGGMVVNDWMLQFLADVIDMPVQRPTVIETTALGAAYLAGLKAGIFDSFDDISQRWQQNAEFTPSMQTQQRDELLSAWQNAVARVLANS
ncbi:MAG: glycerol kinase GlpK [Gammaproteobacteria bacterium]|nr:glycerol kinase GlpK [Gammaproteobacteria bacterium]